MKYHHSCENDKCDYGEWENDEEVDACPVCDTLTDGMPIETKVIFPRIPMTRMGRNGEAIE